MNPKKRTIPASDAPAIFELASQYASADLDNYSRAELEMAAAEAGIPVEYIPQAIAEIQAQNVKKIAKRQNTGRWTRKWLLISSIAIIGSIGWSIATYNAITKRQIQVEAAWAQVENQRQRRADLIPQLVKVTQAYTTHESNLVTTLIEAQQAYLEARSLEQQQDAITKIDQAIDQFQTYALNHSALKSSQLYINLKYEITGTENRLAVERMRYNQAVQSFQQQLQGFPNAVITELSGFESKPFLKAD
ncbi:LemA family protein [Acaryochloris sp. CCMEE 5410]|uniref:LemA family protein n=1 Tax=Acaryochloris sp. CCMEE 5410 TaxID=310037 RepID=UPI0002484428|nr:LemA family protein [Acaryochloris sp. CCMEE 5410]KAI9132580.1 LemA family protein [Acaryochloris sp. CCMEE 5410]